VFHIFFTPKYISIAIIASEGGKNKYCEQGTTDVQSVKVHLSYLFTGSGKEYHAAGFGQGNTYP
jgi:hypothetical protein